MGMYIGVVYFVSFSLTIWVIIILLFLIKLNLLTMVALAGSWIVLLSHGKWWKCLVSFLITSVLVIASEVIEKYLF